MAKKGNKERARQLVGLPKICKGLINSVFLSGIVMDLGWRISEIMRKGMERDIKRLRKQHKYREAKKLEREFEKCWTKSKSKKKTRRKNPKRR